MAWVSAPVGVPGLYECYGTQEGTLRHSSNTGEALNGLTAASLSKTFPDVRCNTKCCAHYHSLLHFLFDESECELRWLVEHPAITDLQAMHISMKPPNGCSRNVEGRG